MRDQEQRVVQHEVGRRNREQHAGHAPDHEGDHERNHPHHRQFEADLAAIHREQPVEDLGPGRDGDDHRRDPEKAVDAGPRSHREEVVQPDQIAENGDDDRRVNHRRIAKQCLAREGRSDLRVDAEDRQDQDIDFRVAPDPHQVPV